MNVRVYRSPREVPRLLVGVTFLVAAVLKTLYPFAFLEALGQFTRIRWPGLPGLGESIYTDLAYAAPVVLAEYAVGLSLTLRRAARAGWIGALLLNVLFVTVLLLHWGQTLKHGCGCLGLPRETTIGPATLWKNFLLFLLLGLTWHLEFSGSRRPPRAGEDRAPTA